MVFPWCWARGCRLLPCLCLRPAWPSRPGVYPNRRPDGCGPPTTSLHRQRSRQPVGQRPYRWHGRGPGPERPKHRRAANVPVRRVPGPPRRRLSRHPRPWSVPPRTRRQRSAPRPECPDLKALLARRRANAPRGATRRQGSGPSRHSLCLLCQIPDLCRTARRPFPASLLRPRARARLLPRHPPLPLGPARTFFRCRSCPLLPPPFRRKIRRRDLRRPSGHGSP